ncbi:unnamed protein product [Caenorhabditis bovis]|uniref:Cadherin domain-containing protein n=1 Tax=Caenorhabditis bovis TaxID=2654633 RepID=A0A8S1F2W9_9PELO|nr:unnamed protein product [Caenorhabditis bovis]
MSTFEYLLITQHHFHFFIASSCFVVISILSFPDFLILRFVAEKGIEHTMGKFKQLGKNIWKRIGPRHKSTTSPEPSARELSSSSSLSSDFNDEYKLHGAAQKEEVVRSLPDISTAFVHSIQIASSDEPPKRVESPHSDDSAGYATDDTALSSLSPLDVKRSSMDYCESQGYYSTSELSPRDEKLESWLIRPRVITPPTSYPRVVVSPSRMAPRELAKSHSELHSIDSPKPQPKIEATDKSVTFANLTDIDSDPIDRFLKNNIYMTKMITTVFEAKNGGMEEIYDDVTAEIDRWFENKNMMAVACEMHYSVPREKRNRRLECKLKEKLLTALRENNRRLLYLRGMGHGKTPIKLAESKTVENISRHKKTDSVRGIYQRSYTKMLPYLHKETPEWHSQYWTLQDFTTTSNDEESTLTPEPQKFLFDDEHPDLLLTATNPADESVSASTILHVQIENVDDNEPKFLKSQPMFYELDSNLTKPTAIGRLSALDDDKNTIFYHILPNCGTDGASNFSIDSEFGEMVYYPHSSTPSRVELCVAVTSMESPNLEEIKFDEAADNMKKVIVQIGDHNSSNRNDFVPGENSVVKIGDSLQFVEIPMQNSGNYSLESLQFHPANFELGRDIISPEGSVGLNPKTGELVANMKIVDTPQGVYTARVASGRNSATKQLHHIKNDRKLRYILAMTRDEFGANLEKFKRQLVDEISTENPGKSVNIYFDEPNNDGKNQSWTSVCFYITRDETILDDKQITSILSKNNGEIAKIHHIFKVVNMDACEKRSTESDSAELKLPMNTLIMITVVAFLILILIGLLVFVCCVARHRRYLENKTAEMRGDDN